MIWSRRKNIEPGSRYVLGTEIANPRVSVSVPRTAHLAVIGESNSGKGSVLANLISQEVASGGEIWFVDLKAGMEAENYAQVLDRKAYNLDEAVALLSDFNVGVDIRAEQWRGKRRSLDDSQATHRLLVIDEAAAPVVRRIFGMALSGMSCRQIATRLNEEHVPTPATYAGLPVGKPGPYTGLWSSERISDMLQNETYIGNMVQGRSRKINYKTKKCIRQQPKDWVVVVGTHEPLIDRETFDKVRRLVDSRRHTRSRTYDFLLKGLIFCHECGYPLAVLNRKNAKGEDVLYFVCRTYQRFTKAGACTCHSIKEQVVTQAVVERVREVCRNYLQAEKLLPIAKQEIVKAQAEADHEKEIAALKAKIDSLSAHLDQVYLDKLSGLLDEADFQRVYQKVKGDRAALEQRLSQIDRPDFSPERQNDLAKELVERFLATAPTNREVLVSLIERVELTEEKEVILHFRFRELEQKG